MMVKRLLAGLTLAVFLLGFTTQLYSNLFQTLEAAESFFIPAESNIWSFEVTKSNPGSGSWWLFGEDRQHHFALSLRRPVYHYIPRDNRCAEVAPQRIETWCSYETSPIPTKQMSR